MNSNLRIFWIAWCCFWALFWFAAGWFSFGLAWLGIPVSLLCILIPIEKIDWRPQPKPWSPNARSLGPEPSPPDRKPGWYPDPWGAAGLARWWDGSAWTSHIRSR